MAFIDFGKITPGKNICNLGNNILDADRFCSIMMTSLYKPSTLQRSRQKHNQHQQQHHLHQQRALPPRALTTPRHTATPTLSRKWYTCRPLRPRPALRRRPSPRQMRPGPATPTRLRHHQSPRRTHTPLQLLRRGPMVTPTPTTRHLRHLRHPRHPPYRHHPRQLHTFRRAIPDILLILIHTHPTLNTDLTPHPRLLATRRPLRLILPPTSLLPIPRCQPTRLLVRLRRTHLHILNTLTHRSMVKE